MDMSTCSPGANPVPVATKVTYPPFALRVTFTIMGSGVTGVGMVGGMTGGVMPGGTDTGGVTLPGGTGGGGTTIGGVPGGLPGAVVIPPEVDFLQVELGLSRAVCPEDYRAVEV